MKKKILVVGITMNCAGTEKSFLSFVNSLDFEKYEVELLLAEKDGLFLSLIPPQVKVTEMEKYGEMFLLSGANAVKTMFSCFIKKNPLCAFELLPYFLKIVFDKKHRSSHATRMWIHFMQKMPEIKQKYDVAIAYWGDRTMFYMCDKVNADIKLSWLHFDYSYPERDDSIYLPYFKRCDKVVTVSKKVDDALKSKLPELSDISVLMENINDSSLIRKLSELGDDYPDRDFDGIRILSVGRIIEQKGFDFIPAVLSRLISEGFNIRWYILGTGDTAQINALMSSCEKFGVTDRLHLLGTSINPYTYMKNCDIYAQPSRYEGKPITVDEALILAKPIVVSNYLSASEQLKDGEYGIICDIGEQGLYDGIKQMLTLPNKREEFSELLAQKDFGNSREIEKFYKMIEK